MVPTAQRHPRTHRTVAPLIRHRAAESLACTGPGAGVAACGVSGPFENDPVPRLSYAFVSSHRGNDDLFRVAVNISDRSDRFFLTCERVQDNDPAVSDDGSKVAFASDRNGGWDVYVLRGTCLNFDERRDAEPRGCRSTQ